MAAELESGIQDTVDWGRAMAKIAVRDHVHVPKFWHM